MKFKTFSSVRTVYYWTMCRQMFASLLLKIVTFLKFKMKCVKFACRWFFQFVNSYHVFPSYICFLLHLFNPKKQNLCLLKIKNLVFSYSLSFSAASSACKRKSINRYQLPWRLGLKIKIKLTLTTLLHISKLMFNWP